MRFAVADAPLAATAADLVVIPVLLAGDAPDFAPVEAALARCGGAAAGARPGPRRRTRSSARDLTTDLAAVLAASGFTGKAEALLPVARGDGGWPGDEFGLPGCALGGRDQNGMVCRH